MKYLRKYRLRIGVPDREYITAVDGVLVPSEAVEINNLHVEFDIEKSDDSSKNLNSAVIRIYNASETTKSLIEKDDSVVILEAGWEDDSFGVIFQGDVVSYQHVKDSSNTITEIECADGYIGVRESITHKEYDKGTSVLNVLMDLIKGESGDSVYYTARGKNIGTRPPSGLGLSIGEMRGLGLFNIYDNGITIAKPTKQAVDDICYSNRLKWSIQDGKVYVTDIDGDDVFKYTVPLISEDTGLIGSPRKVNESKRKRKNDKTPTKGYNFTCTLNHEMVPELFIKLVSEELDVTAKVKKVKHTGSFEGDSWETEVECIIQDIY